MNDEVTPTAETDADDGTALLVRPGMTVRRDDPDDETTYTVVAMLGDKAILRCGDDVTVEHFQYLYGPDLRPDPAWIGRKLDGETLGGETDLLLSAIADTDCESVDDALARATAAIDRLNADSSDAAAISDIEQAVGEVERIVSRWRPDAE